MDSIKDVVRSSVKVPEFDKHLKKAGGHISQNVVEITIKMKTKIKRGIYFIQQAFIFSIISLSMYLALCFSI